MRSRLQLLALFLAPLGVSACDGPLAEDSDATPDSALTGEALFHDGSVAELETARTLAAAHLAPLAAERGLDGLSDLVPNRLDVDELQMADVRVQQHHRGVKVFGGEAMVHLDQTGALIGVQDHLVADLDVDVVPTVDMADAIEIAVQQAGGWAVLTDDPQADLWVVRHDDQDHLAWRVQLRREDGTPQTDLPVIFVDAHTREAFWRLTNMKTAAGTGTSNYAGTVSIKVYKPAGDTYYYLEDTSRGLGSYSMGGTYSSAYYVYDSDVNFTESWQTEGVDGLYAGAAVLDYYDDVHGRNGIDGAGGPDTVDSLTGTGQVVAIYVNYGEDYANAYWDGYEMVIGDGDGTYFGPLTTVDIIGHEMTHGVTQYTAGFTYYGEPGALDEGYADIFGAMTERHLDGESADTWKMAEDCTLPAWGDALRYMDDPSSDGYTVDHYDDFYCDPSDSCGVHANLGILTLAYYLLSEGGTHPTYGGITMAGIGADTAELIAYRALKKYSSADTDFHDARNSWLDAATDLYTAGSTQYKQTMNAWGLVGVGETSRVSTCSGYDYPFTGTLDGAGTYKYYVKSTGATYTAGTIRGKLVADSGTDFDIFLQMKGSDGKWSTVAKSKTAGTSTESFSYTAAAGTYRLMVKSLPSTGGSGDFVACLDKP